MRPAMIGASELTPVLIAIASPESEAKAVVP